MNRRIDPPTPPESAAITTPPSDAPAQARQVASGIILKNRYQVDAAIASGGMAQVWRGVDQILNRPVALKILHPHLATDDAFLTRFRREAVASARLTHSSIVAVYDTVSEDGIEAIVMELIDGTTLRTVLDSAGQLQPGEVVEIGAAIADALDTAHRAGVVHRDIKPANIMVSKERRVVVTDFGIAKANKDADLTHTGTLLGTAKYLAPEQVAGETVDPRADLYSLGVVLFESITGKPPFKAQTDAATALARLQGDAPLCKEFRPDTPDDLNAIIARSMARQPDDRFDRASSMRTALLAANLSNVTPLGQAGVSGAATERQPPPSTPEQAPGDGQRTTSWAPPAGQPVQPPGPPPTGEQRPPFRSGTAVMPLERRQPSTDPSPTKKGQPPKRRSASRSRKRQGSAPVITPKQKPTASNRPMRVAAFTLILAGFGLAGLLLWSILQGDGLSDLTPDTEDFTGRGDVTIIDAIPFDPFDQGGSHTEQNSKAALAFDKDLDTVWQTETYRRAEFSGLKEGVGLTLFLSEETEVSEIEISTSGTGWSVEIYVGNDIGPNNGEFDMATLGSPVGSIENGEGTPTIDLDNQRGSQVLLWITETGLTFDENRGGEVHRFVLNEVALS